MRFLCGSYKLYSLVCGSQVAGRWMDRWREGRRSVRIGRIERIKITQNAEFFTKIKKFSLRMQTKITKYLQIRIFFCKFASEL